MHGFDLAAFGGPDRTIHAIELWSGALLLQRLDLANQPVGVRDNIGLGNLRVSQWPPATPVPEPASGLLVGARLLAVCLVRRRGGVGRRQGRPWPVFS